MARLRREPQAGPAPANLGRFRLPEWFDPDEPVPGDHLADANTWRALRAFRRYQEAKRAWKHSQPPSHPNRSHRAHR